MLKSSIIRLRVVSVSIPRKGNLRSEWYLVEVFVGT
jgi:hypothetical protein